MIGVSQSRPLALRRKVGLRLRTRREALGMKRSFVARHLGYTNLGKGSTRIAEWERGTIVPMLAEDKFFELLQLEAEPIRAELRRARQIQKRIERLGHDSLAEERTLLCTHAHRLLKRAGRIGRDPKMGGVRTPAARLSLLYVGGGPLPLGALVGAWREGALVAKTDAHGSVLLFGGAGSPFSGSGRCTGADKSGQRRHLQHSPSRYLPRDARSLWSGKRAPSPWSLADVVAAIGGKAPCSYFWRLDEDAEPVGDPIACYHPRRRKLEVARTLSLDPAALGPKALQERISHRGLSVGGGPSRPLQVGGLTIGAFNTSQVIHPCGLRTGDGCVEGKGKWFPVKVTGPCPPPAVLPLLSGLLKLIEEEEEPSEQ
jgi:transcriptional regulator with XRE-family HTH domain